MKKVKAIKAHRTVEGLFDKGDIFIQFFDQPFIFYPENSESGCGLDIRLMDKRGGYFKYFDDIKPVDISENEYYQRRKREIEDQIRVINAKIYDLQLDREKLLQYIYTD